VVAYGSTDPPEVLDEHAVTKVVATGGLSRLVADNTELIDVVDPQLVLDGLRIIYERARR
jgi:pantothenate kinase type III